MQQYVQNVSHLIGVEVDLSTLTTEETPLVSVPNGSEILHVSVEVEEISDVGVTIDLGVKDRIDYFLNDIALDNKSSAIRGKVLNMPYTQQILGKLSENSAKGKLKIRVQYFTPSKILHEC